MSVLFPKVEAFRTRLEQSGSDFICTSRLPAAVTTVSFLGQFQSQTVLWNMTLATLAHYRQSESAGIAGAGQRLFNCPFIEIDAGVEGVFQLRVGLDLEIIDEPAIKKSIIMIRNYKRLVIGKIEFCSGNT